MIQYSHFSERIISKTKKAFWYILPIILYTKEQSLKLNKSYYKSCIRISYFYGKVTEIIHSGKQI